MPQRDSIELIRLEKALPLVEANKTAEFRRAAEEAPFLLRSLGLGAGLSVLAAKRGRREDLADMLAKWLLRDCPHHPYDQAQVPNISLALTAITGGSRAQYRAAHIEALGFATALKRLAQALCPTGEAEP